MQLKTTSLWTGRRMYILLFVMTILLIALTIYLTHRWKQGLDEQHPEIGFCPLPTSFDKTFQNHPKENSI